MLIYYYYSHIAVTALKTAINKRSEDVQDILNEPQKRFFLVDDSEQDEPQKRLFFCRRLGAG